MDRPLRIFYYSVAVKSMQMSYFRTPYIFLSTAIFWFFEDFMYLDWSLYVKFVYAWNLYFLEYRSAIVKFYYSFYFNRNYF